MSQLTEYLLFIVSVIVVIMIIDFIPIRHEIKKEIDTSLPSCKHCKKTLNDFCSSKYCSEPNCKIDPRCKKEIQYSCSEYNFLCNENTCSDFDKYKNDKTWGCYGMF